MTRYDSPRFSDLLKARENGLESDLPWRLHDKLKCYEFFQAIGADTPKIYRKFTDPSEIDFHGLPDNFVLKPTYMHSSIGVMVLQRLTENDFFDHMRGKKFTLADIVGEQTRIAQKKPGRSEKTLIVEEKVVVNDGEEIPRDFKFFAFQGDIAFIQQVGNGSGKSSHAWFDGEFNPLPPGEVTSNPRFFAPARPERPADWRLLIEAARRVSVAVPAPFARIDTYSSIRGPLMGEVTLVPGVILFEGYVELSERMERLAGSAWRDATVRLGRSLPDLG